MLALYRREPVAAGVWAYRTEGHTLAFLDSQVAERTQHWPGEGSGGTGSPTPLHEGREGVGLEIQHQMGRFVRNRA